MQCASMGVSINLAPIVLSRGFHLQTAGLLLSVFSAAALVAKLGSGLLADRLGNRTPLALLAVSTAAGTSLLAVAHQAGALYGAVALVGLSGGIWTMLASATAAEFGPQGFGRAYGVISAFTPLGSLAPPVVAWLYERQGDYAGALLALAAFALVVGGGGALLLKEQRA
jgi:MFS family permease